MARKYEAAFLLKEGEAGKAAEGKDLELQARIEAARAMNAAGTVFFSYSGINSCAYWADLANGPFALPAIVPQPNWK